MQGERERLQVLAIGVLDRFPALDRGVARRHHRPGLGGIIVRVGAPLRSGQGLRGFCEVLVRLAQVATKSQGIALDDLMSDMEELRHAQTLQPLVGKLAQGLGAGTATISASINGVTGSATLTVN